MNADELWNAAVQVLCENDLGDWTRYRRTVPTPPGGPVSEYLEPYTNEPLGSTNQSWTASVAVDWLALDR
ncbi:MAG: hypothetical protein JOZ81_21115 [Chloroflexi bacterium]|nr:hypothetical protein [Chloroflexota bacterium]MBV9547475.1 hypothetical protein [Chloroflexota bacterium]